MSRWGVIVCITGALGDRAHGCRFQQQTQADLEALVPPPVAAMLWQAYTYADEYGCVPRRPVHQKPCCC